MFEQLTNNKIALISSWLQSYTTLDSNFLQLLFAYILENWLIFNKKKIVSFLCGVEKRKIRNFSTLLHLFQKFL